MFRTGGTLAAGATIAALLLAVQGSGRTATIDASGPGERAKAPPRHSESAGATAAVRPVPISGSLQFDLVCDLRGRIVSDSDPSSRGTYPVNVPAWSSVARFIVDIRAMQYCERVACGNVGPHRIAGIHAAQIVLNDEPWLTTTVRRRDGWYRSRLSDDGRVDEDTGLCKMERFSGFPAHRRNSGNPGAP